MSASAGSISDTLALGASTHRIPQLGFGVYKSPPEVCEASTSAALRAGYIHIDTAQFYRNEAEVGEALSKSGLPRSSVFITTKVLTSAGSVEATLAKCRESVRKLDRRPAAERPYVDLFLIHSPNAGAAVRRELWTALEALKAEGLARDIGVSNYGRGHIEEMKTYASATWPPAANQIELHPWCQQRECVDYCRAQGIVVQAYSPLTRMQRAYEPVLVDIAKKHGKQSSQVLIRYALQKGWVPLPKSDNEDRIKANRDIYDFVLSDEDMKALNDMDEGNEGAIVQAVINDV